MHIKKIELKNFQVISDFSADFEGNIYLVKGENELGKSTLLKAIGAMLTGNRDEVLKNGEEKGFAKMIVGDDGREYEVELRFTKANPRGTLSIRDKNGMKSDNVSMLQRVMKYTDFDAVEFCRLSETAEGRRKQIQVIKNLLPEDVRKRIESIDVETETIKGERKEQNSTVKTLSVMKQSASVSDDDVAKYTEKINIADLVEKQKQVAAKEEQAKGVQERMGLREKELADIPHKKEMLKDDYEVQLAQIETDRQKAMEIYNAAIARCEEKAQLAKEAYDKGIAKTADKEKELSTAIEQATKWLADYNANKPQSVEQDLKDAEEHNRKCDDVAKFLEVKERYDAAVAEVAKSEEKLTELAAERKSLITTAKLPVSGLTFTDDGLFLNDVPFVAGKVSDSQMIEVAFSLCVASNTAVQVFKIGRGESLGAKRLKAIADMANKRGFQGFIEQVVRGQNDLRVEEYEEV